jgi:translocation and assembly module TamB
MSGPTVRIETKLGEDVSVRRGTDVRVDLRGGPTLTLTDKLRATGEVTLHGGTLNLYGKQFDIEQGTVTFVGDDISNPQVSVVAGWVAGDGTQIKAVFRGPLKTGKVTLQSQPSLSDNEIVQLLLFGSTDGQAASTQGAPGVSSAEGVAGTVATAPLNRALAQFGLSAVSAKVDTSAVNAKPEIEVQIAKGLSVAVAQILGQPPVGSNPDTAFLTVDWRFLKKWSVAATVGNAGSTIVDLLWRYRY